jgi:hypothetical protein
MTDKTQPKRGRPRMPTNTKRAFNFRIRDDLRQRLTESAERAGRSLTEETEFRLNRDFAWEAAKGDIEQMVREAAKELEASRIKAIRAAGLTILREIDGKPTRAVVELERLLAEADGIARGMFGSGWVDDKAPPPLPTRSMSPEEVARLEEKLEELRRELRAATSGKSDKVA